MCVCVSNASQLAAQTLIVVRVSRILKGEPYGEHNPEFLVPLECGR